MSFIFRYFLSDLDCRNYASLALFISLLISTYLALTCTAEEISIATTVAGRDRGSGNSRDASKPVSSSEVGELATEGEWATVPAKTRGRRRQTGDKASSTSTAVKAADEIQKSDTAISSEQDSASSTESKESDSGGQTDQNRQICAVTQLLLAKFHGSYFEFNDSIITPMTIRDISKAFEGRDSAYILVYRRIERNAVYCGERAEGEERNQLEVDSIWEAANGPSDSDIHENVSVVSVVSDNTESTVVCSNSESTMSVDPQNSGYSGGSHNRAYLPTPPKYWLDKALAVNAQIHQQRNQYRNQSRTVELELLFPIHFHTALVSENGCPLSVSGGSGVSGGSTAGSAGSSDDSSGVYVRCPLLQRRSGETVYSACLQNLKTSTFPTSPSPSHLPSGWQLKVLYIY